MQDVTPAPPWSCHSDKLPPFTSICQHLITMQDVTPAPRCDPSPSPLCQHLITMQDVTPAQHLITMQDVTPAQFHHHRVSLLQLSIHCEEH